MGATKRLAETGRARDGVAGVPARRRAVRQRPRQQRQRAPDHARRVRRGRPIPTDRPDGDAVLHDGVGEAVALVMRADLLGSAAEIFWLDMGESDRDGRAGRPPARARRGRGLRAVPIEVIGLRPGEKRNEVLADPASGVRTHDRSAASAWPANGARALIDSSGAGGGSTPVESRRWSHASGARRVGANDPAVLEALAAMPGGFRPSQMALGAARREPTEPGRQGTGRMRILHLATFLQGGAGRVITDLALAQHAAGHQVRVVASAIRRRPATATTRRISTN